MRPEGAAETAALVQLIEDRAGLVVPARDHGRLEELARRRAAALRQSGMSGYLALLRTAEGAAEWRELLARLTIKESYLFRAPQQFRALAEQVLPELARRRTGRGLRAWSAGCARGEEAATLAVVLAEQPELAGTDWRVLATDIDEEALEIARTGRFGRRAVAKVPEGLLARYFDRHRELWALRSELLRRVEFQVLNLVGGPLHPPGAPFDLVLLRNVLIYFREEAQERVVAELAARLADDGYLFLGPAESLIRLDTALEPVDLGDCFAYRRRRAVDTATPARPPKAPSPPAPVPPPLPALRSEAPFTDPRTLVEDALGAVAGGRFDDAARLAESAARAAPSDPTARGLLGLCRELTGDLQSAIQSYRAALYLEPGLVQVRFLLARCLGRMGWASRGRGEYREILATLRADAVRPFDLAERLELPEVEEVAERCRQQLELEDSGAVPPVGGPDG